MRFGAYFIIGGTAAALSFTACGFPAIGYTDASNSSSSSSASSGGEGGQTSGMGGMDAVGGMGGEGGMGGFGPECVYGEVGSCGTGNKCELIDEDAGPAGGVTCIQAGDHPDYSVCATSSDCLDGAYCDRFNEVCQRVCSGGVCNSDQACVKALGPGGDFAVNVNVCTANCHPISTSPCSSFEGPTNCYLVSNTGWECTKSLNKVAGDDCQSASECGPGMGCIGSMNAGTCRYWCTNPLPMGNLNQCGSGSACFKLPVPGAFHNGVEYGYCSI